MVNLFGAKLKTKHLFMPLMAFVAALSLPFVYFASTRDQDTRSQAADSYFTFTVDPAVGADVYFDPGTTTLTNDTPIRIKANYPANDIAFIKVVATFDPAKIKITSEINPNPAFTTVVQKTTMASANSNGKIELVIAASPADTPQRGNFEIANFNISPVAGVITGTTAITFVPQEMQIVDSNTQALSVNPGNLYINFNIAGGTPVPTITPQPQQAVINVFFDPSTLLLTGDSQIMLKANYPDNDVAFIRAVVTFDPAKIQLATEITTNPAFSTTVSKTTMAQANTSGRIEIVSASAPTDTVQRGLFEIAGFHIVPVAGATGTTVMNYVAADMQIVDKTTQAQLPINPGNLVININASATEVSPLPTNSQNPGATVTPRPEVTQGPGEEAEPTEQPESDENGNESTDSGNRDKANQETHPNIPEVVTKKIGDFNNDGKVTFADLFDWIKSLFTSHETNE